MKTSTIIISTVGVIIASMVFCAVIFINIANITFTEVNVEDLGNGSQRVTTVVSVYDDNKEDYVDDTICTIINKSTGAEIASKAKVNDEDQKQIILDVDTTYKNGVHQIMVLRGYWNKDNKKFVCKDTLLVGIRYPNGYTIERLYDYVNGNKEVKERKYMHDFKTGKTKNE